MFSGDFVPLPRMVTFGFFEDFPFLVIRCINTIDFVAAFLADIGSWCALLDCSKENMNSEGHWIPTPPVTTFASMEGHQSVGLGHGLDSFPSRFFVDFILPGIG